MDDRIEQHIVITVTAVESGFAALDARDDVRQAGLKANTGGWEQELTDLRKRAEEPPAT
jgi:hypothetical protein